MKSYKDFISESEQLDERIRLPGRIRIPGRGPKPPGGRGPKPPGGGRQGPRGPRGPGGGGGNPLGGVSDFVGGLFGGAAANLVWDGAKWVAGEALGLLKQPIGQDKTAVAKGNDQKGLSRVT